MILTFLIAALWIVAILWWSRVLPALLFLGRVPDLNDRLVEQPLSSIAVIVPARNEAASIERTLRSLDRSDYKQLEVIAIDDRSTDATGAIMDSLHLERVRTLHITALPEGWTGKLNAMATAANQSRSDWILFTDADVVFAPSALTRAVAAAEREAVDHLVLIPTMEIRSVGEGVLLGFFQVLSTLVVRLWKVPDPKSKFDVVGVGAFNLVRRSAYEQIGSFAAFPMEIVEDVRLAREIKRAGFNSRAVFGRDLIRIHWASGLRGLVQVLTKNMFAGMGFEVLIAVPTIAALLFATFVPFVGLFFHRLQLPSLVTVAAMFAVYLQYARRSGISALNFFGAPIASLAMVFALSRSTLVTLLNGGVTWRGTFYPLQDLRRQRGPLW